MLTAISVTYTLPSGDWGHFRYPSEKHHSCGKGKTHTWFCWQVADTEERWELPKVSGQVSNVPGKRAACSLSVFTCCSPEGFNSSLSVGFPRDAPGGATVGKKQPYPQAVHFLCAVRVSWEPEDKHINSALFFCPHHPCRIMVDSS